MASGPIEFFLGVVTGLERPEDRVAQFLAIQGLGLDTFGENIHTEAGEDRVLQAFEIPIRDVNLDCAELIHQIAEDAGDVILENQFLLIHTFQQLMAQAVHGLALLVHDVVVFQQVFLGFEILRLHGFLRFLDPP